MKKNRSTLISLPICIFILGYGQNQAAVGPGLEQKMNAKEIKLLIDSISNALNRWYVYPKKGALMADAYIC
jgi:hypothetical protein